MSDNWIAFIPEHRQELEAILGTRLRVIYQHL
jgi:hypothetical protein